MSIYIPKRKDGTSKSPFYQYDFVLKPAGQTEPRRFTGSTGVRTLKAARQVESAIRESAALGKLDQAMTVRQATDKYWIEIGQHAPTKHAKRQQLLCLADLCEYYGADVPLMSITPKAVAEAAAKRAACPVLRKKRINGELLWAPTDKMPAPATVNRQVVEPMRRILRRAKKTWGLTIDLERFQWGGTDGLKMREPAERIRALTVDEELRWWDALDPDYHLIAELYLISGKRQSNWLGVSKFRVDLRAGTVRMDVLKKKQPEETVVELTARELEIVTEAYHQDPKSTILFTAPSQRPRDKGARRPITARMLYDHLKAAFRTAEMPDVRPHDLRHTFATRALHKRPDIPGLMKAMDHASIASTMRYAKIADRVAREMRASVSRAVPSRPGIVPETISAGTSTRKKRFRKPL
jgi:integrase